MTQVFISHSSSDRTLVEQELVPLLKQHSIAVWYSREAITTSALWEREIRQGLRASDWFLVVLSRFSADSEWVQAEVQWALENRRERLVPIMIGDCDPTDINLQLIRYQYVDFRKELKDARSRLLSVWGQAVEHERALQLEVEFIETTEAESGDDAGRRTLAIYHRATVGTDPANELCVRDSFVSRRHAELKVRVFEGRKSLWFVDLATSNGSFINGNRVLAPVMLSEEDIVKVGEVRILIHRIIGTEAE